MARHNEIGAIGERAVLNHLIRKGFRHIASNHKEKPGEIDLIMEKDKTVHFVEVKTVSRGNFSSYSGGVTHETYRPIENVHRKKLRNLLNTIQIWISRSKYEGEWQLDVASVWIDPEKREGKVHILENVIVE